MANQTVFFLSDLSDLPSLQLLLFLIFLLIYLLTLTWNLLIVSLIVTDSHLHTPMYFFLGNLASIDLCTSSVTVPRMLFDLHTQRKAIARTTCTAQFFLFFLFVNTEVFLLATMSYDRYIAICRPLHYMQIMHWRVCVQLASGAWSLGFAHSLLHTMYSLKLSFCGSHTINSFFCDLPQLISISCSDVFENILLIFLVGSILAGGTLMVTFLPYVYIIQTVRKMKVGVKRKKIVSTCSSHLTVVFVFYASCMFTYFRSSSGNQFAGDKVVAIFYSVITPLLNPLIYSLRNQDFRRAFEDILKRIISGDISLPL